MQLKVENLGRQLKSKIESMGLPQNMAPPEITELTERISKPLLRLKDNRQTTAPADVSPYNPVQQNVPAWALFGMFFTAIPIAGGILHERKSGIWIRLTSLPVSPLLLFTAKVLAYIGVCLCQFMLISLIGSYLFPYIGLPAFTVSTNPAAVLLAIFFSSLAVCGYGIFLGTICDTYEKASTVGATTVVIAAALGGVMVPVYAMPNFMQKLSIISPLNWGLTAIHDLLLRGYSYTAILDDIARLTLFFLLTIFFAWKLSRRRI